MKKIFRFLVLSLALMGIISACDILNPVIEPADIGLGIKVFFPTKVVTNQPMTINGSGFRDATEIVFPNGVSVTDFEIVSNDMIRVNAPAGIAADGGTIIVRTATEQAESAQKLTVGRTNVSGFSKQAGEEIQGGEQITIYGVDLEFISGVELLDADGNPIILSDAAFYRKGTSSVVITIPKKVYEGTFTGKLFTYDGQEILLPELAYKPAAEGGHWETQLVPFWENDGSKGAVSWSSDYRFAGEGFSTGEEIYTIPAAIWNRLKSETFYLKVQATDPQIRVTTGWWSTTWTGGDFQPGNELLTDNGDGTFTLEINLSGDPILEVMDVQHLLFTGDRFTPIALCLPEEVWVEGGEGHMEIVKESIWKNDGSKGAVSWSSDYRFASESNKTGEEIYAIPDDIWEKMKGGTFYVDVQGENPQVRITTGWWSTTWTGGDFQPGNELLTDNGDGTFTLAVTLGDDPIQEVIDVQHLLITGDRFTPLEIYFAEEVWVDGGDAPQEELIWENDGSHGAVSWSSEYRFSNETNKTGEEIYAIPDDVWDQIKSGTFYVLVEGENPQVRITTGWWSTTWTDNDYMPGSEGLTDNGDGTWTLAVTLGDDPIMDVIDVQHLLVTGDRFTPKKLYFLK